MNTRWIPLACIPLMAACGAVENEPRASSTSVPVDASTERLLGEFASCSEEVLDEGPEAGQVSGITFVAQTEQWWRVRDIVSYDAVWTDEEIPDLAVVLVDSPTGTSQRTLGVLFRKVWDPATWAMSNDAEIYFGVEEGTGDVPTSLRTAVLVLPDGRALFVGGCEAQWSNTDVRPLLGADPDATLRNAVAGYGTEGNVLDAFLPTDVLEETTSEPGEALLNPDTFPVAELEELNSAAITYRVSGGVEGDVICTKNDLGWNDCVPVAETNTLGSYLAGEDLEFWLVDSTVPQALNHPVTQLGVLRISDSYQGKDLVIDVEFTLTTDRAGQEGNQASDSQMRILELSLYSGSE